MPTKTKPKQGYRVYSDHVELSSGDREHLAELFGYHDTGDVREILDGLQECLSRYEIFVRDAEQAPQPAHSRAEIELIEQAAIEFYKSAGKLMDCLAPSRLTISAGQLLEPAVPPIERAARASVVPGSKEDATWDYEQRRAALWSKSLPALRGETMFLATHARKVLDQWPTGIRSDNAARRRDIKNLREKLLQKLSAYFAEHTKDAGCLPEFLTFCRTKIKGGRGNNHRGRTSK